jgi:hypothetical protein
MLVDQKTKGVIVPLNAELKLEGWLELANSTLTRELRSSILDLLIYLIGFLSEMAVLGARCFIVLSCYVNSHADSLSTVQAGNTRTC